MSMMSTPTMNRGATGLGGRNNRTGGGDIIPKGYNKGQLSQFTPEQTQLFQQLFSHLGPESYLGKLAGGDESQFAQIEAPALKQFAGLQGNIASRFSGMGSGARRSSGFQNTMSQASQDFASQLQANRMGLQRQAIQDLMGMGNQLLGHRTHEQFLTQKDMPFWKKLLAGVSPAFAQGAGQATGNAMFGNNNNQQQQTQQNPGLDIAKLAAFLA